MTPNKFNSFVLEVGKGTHNLSTDQLMVALTDVAPVATDAVLTDITEISYTNLSTRNITTTSWTQTSGTATLILADLVLTASGTVPQFRYAVIYNSTDTNKSLVAYLDYGSELNLEKDDTFTLDFDNTNGFLTLI